MENTAPRKSETKDDESARSNEDDKRIDVCLEVKEPVSCGDCERICAGGFLRNRVLFRAEPNESSQNGDSNEVFKINGDSIEEKRESPESRTEDKERRKNTDGSDYDGRSLDEDARSAYDDVSLQSRSMSLTSSCSLSVTGKQTKNKLFYFISLIWKHVSLFNP